MNYDFDTIIARRGTDCEKWDLPAEDGVLPLWVAGMDFRAAPAIVDALCRRVEEGVFGYALPSGSWHESLVRWLNVRHRWQVSSDTVIDAIGVVPAHSCLLLARRQGNRPDACLQLFFRDHPQSGLRCA